MIERMSLICGRSKSTTAREAAKQSWDAFRQDPEWQKVAKESQRDGQFLRERPESVYMTATDYSAIQ